MRRLSLLALTWMSALSAAHADIPPPPPVGRHLGDPYAIVAGVLVSALAMVAGLYVQRRRNGLPVPSGRLVGAVSAVLAVAAAAFLIQCFKLG